MIILRFWPFCRDVKTKIMLFNSVPRAHTNGDHACYLVGLSSDDLMLGCQGIASDEKHHFFRFEGSPAGRTPGDSSLSKFVFPIGGKSTNVFVKYAIPDDDDGVGPEDKDRGEGRAKRYSLMNISPAVL
jgi:hypothetical protein